MAQTLLTKTKINSNYCFYHRFFLHTTCSTLTSALGILFCGTDIIQHCSVLITFLYSRLVQRPQKNIMGTLVQPYKVVQKTNKHRKIKTSQSKELQHTKIHKATLVHNCFHCFSYTKKLGYLMIFCNKGKNFYKTISWVLTHGNKPSSYSTV